MIVSVSDLISALGNLSKDDNHEIQSQGGLPHEFQASLDYILKILSENNSNIAEVWYNKKLHLTVDIFMGWCTDVLLTQYYNEIQKYKLKRVK